MSDDRPAGAPSHLALGTGREFDAVRALLARWGTRASGIGDDAAVLDVPAGERLVVSTDSSVEDVHFRRDWLTPEEIGWRATTSALSDLAAMAARPVGILTALTMPASWRPHLDALADGMGAAAHAAGAPIVGGDLTGGDALSITVTVLGAASHPVTRSGARAGDRLYVTGRLGGPARALDAFLRGADPDPADRARFARPEARIREGVWLARHGARALVDVSDGLLADLGHVGAASDVVCVIDEARVPRVAGATAGDAMRGGEEYELACAMPHALDVAAFAREFGVELTEIGRVEARMADEAAGTRLAGGPRVDLPPGHDHFSR